MNDKTPVTPPKKVKIRKLSQINKSSSTNNLLRIRNFRFAQKCVDNYFDDSDSSNIPTPTPTVTLTPTNITQRFEESDTESEQKMIGSIKKINISN